MLKFLSAKKAAEVLSQEDPDLEVVIVLDPLNKDTEKVINHYRSGVVSERLRRAVEPGLVSRSGGEPEPPPQPLPEPHQG